MRRGGKKWQQLLHQTAPQTATMKRHQRSCWSSARREGGWPCALWWCLWSCQGVASSALPRSDRVFRKVLFEYIVPLFYSTSRSFKYCNSQNPQALIKDFITWNNTFTHHFYPSEHFLYCQFTVDGTNLQIPGLGSQKLSSSVGKEPPRSLGDLSAQQQSGVFPSWTADA